MSDRPAPYHDPNPLNLAERPGYGRPKPTSAWVGQGFWLVAGVAGAVAFSGVTHRVLAFASIWIALSSIVWIEWSERCEDRRKVRVVLGVIMIAVALLVAHGRANRSSE